MPGGLQQQTGLTSAEVAERIADGRVNRLPDAPSRTTAQIVRANVLTPINLVIGVLLAAVLVAEGGPSPDMLFAGVIVSNSLIGIVQELRARAALNRLAVLTEPVARVIRDGVEEELDIEEVVVDDIIVLAPGGEVVVDGEVVDAAGLEMNESLLTGEQDPVGKERGDEVLSGSFVSSGSGVYRAVKVGGDAYAAQLAEEARKFSLVDSELRQGVNTILKVLMVLIPPIAGILYWRLRQGGEEWREALTSVVASSVAMVPDGLVLLTSLAFMAGVVTLARRQALLRELASVELLARVDTLCLDKTGTITTGTVVVADTVPLDGVDGSLDPGVLLAACGGSDPDPNPTQAAIRAAYGDDPGWEVVDTVPFSSARKWSAAEFRDPSLPGGSIAVYLGAPEFLMGDAHPDIAEQVATRAGEGQRVVLLATASALTGDELPGDLVPRALVALQDEVREDAEATLAYFTDQGIRLKVISGDHPGTVAAVARRAGVPDAEEGIDARELPEDPDQLASVVARHTVFGRVTPRQKRAMVLSLQSQGHVVAMTGDGVNDVLALKDADMGIAMGSGSGASRSVAQLVLLNDQFKILPGVLAEGRRVMNSVERASNLFIYGTVYAILISLVIAAVGVEFPFLPRHLTLVRVLSVGIPGFFLALAADPRRARPGFLPRVIRFSIPAGMIAAASALTVYFSARVIVGATITEERTAATITLLGVGLGLLIRLTSTLPRWRWILVGAMGLCVVASMTLWRVSDFFELSLPPADVLIVIVLVQAAAQTAIRLLPVSGEEAPGVRATGSAPTPVG